MMINGFCFARNLVELVEIVERMQSDCGCQWGGCVEELKKLNLSILRRLKYLKDFVGNCEILVDISGTLNCYSIFQEIQAFNMNEIIYKDYVFRNKHKCTFRKPEIILEYLNSIGA